MVAYQTSQMQRQDPLLLLLPLLLLALLGPGLAPAARPVVTDVCPPDLRAVRPRCGPVSSGTPLRATPGTVRVIT